MRYSEPLTYRGQTKSMSEWAALTGISLQTLCSRRRKGWSAEDIISKPARVKGQIVYNGIVTTWDALGSQYGIRGSTLRNRVIRRHMTIQEALDAVGKKPTHQTNVFKHKAKRCCYPDCDHCPYPDCESD